MKSNVIRTQDDMSELSKVRISTLSEIPEPLENRNYTLVGIKKYKPYTQ